MKRLLRLILNLLKRNMKNITTTIRVSPSIIGEGGNAESRVVVAETDGRDAKKVTMLVSALENFNVSFDPLMAASTGLPVLNSDWSYKGIKNGFHTFTTNTISANTVTAFGFTISHVSTGDVVIEASVKGGNSVDSESVVFL